MADLVKSTVRNRAFKMVLSSDHYTPATGKTVAVNLSKDGGVFSTAAGVVSELSNGWYSINLTIVDTGTLGDLAFSCTASGCDPKDFTDQVVAYNPGDAVRLGLTALPNANASTVNGLPVSGVGTGKIATDSSGRVTVGSNADKTGYALSAAGLDQIVVEVGINARQAMSLMAAALAGVLAGGGSTTITLAAVGNPGTNRISATIDTSNNNRTAMALNPPT